MKVNNVFLYGLTPLWKGVMIVFHVTMNVTSDTPRKWKYQGSKAAAGSSSSFFFFFSSLSPMPSF